VNAASLAFPVGVLGVVLNLVFVWPQVVRGLRTTEGVSVLTALLGVLARVTWTVYGLARADALYLWANLPIAIGFLAVVAAVGLRRPSARRAIALGIPAIVLLLVAVSWSYPLLAALAMVSAGVVVLPQAVAALRAPGRLAGVSGATYVLTATASACWLVYGILVQDAVTVVPHLVIFPTAVVVVIAKWRGGRANSSNR
jgi:uncharacterized protein with PQ loop repeat